MVRRARLTLDALGYFSVPQLTGVGVDRSVLVAGHAVVVTLVKCCQGVQLDQTWCQELDVTTLTGRSNFVVVVVPGVSVGSE